MPALFTSTSGQPSFPTVCATHLSTCAGTPTSARTKRHFTPAFRMILTASRPAARIRIRDRHRIARVCEAQRHRPADSPRAAGDREDLHSRQDLDWLVHPLHADHFDAGDFSLRQVRPGNDRLLEAKLAASFNLSWPRGAGRTSPARPTSPNTTVFSLYRPVSQGPCQQAQDPRRARRCATPPTAFTNTSCSQVAMPAWRLSTQRRRGGSAPGRRTERRRGLGVCRAPPAPGSPPAAGACLPASPARSNRRRSSRGAKGTTPTDWQPRAGPCRSWRTRASSLTTPKRFFTARTSRRSRNADRPRSRAPCPRCAPARAARRSRPPW